MRAIKQTSNIYIQLAKRNLERKAVRTILAAVGIIVGVFAISSMGILGNCLKVSVTNSFEGYSNEILVYPAGEETSITEKQVEQLDKVGGIESVVPIYSSYAKIEFKDKSIYGNVYGIESKNLISFTEINDGKMLKSRSSDCVIGPDIADSLAINVGNKVILENTTFKVIGILKKRGISPDVSSDKSIFVNPDIYKRIFTEKDDGYNYVIIKAKDDDSVDKVENSVNKTLNRKEDKVYPSSVNSMLITFSNISRYVSLFLMGIGSISLVVASISILNVMLMSVTERTKEIGIMKAVGASRNDIKKTFLYESLILGIISSFIGGVLSLIVVFCITGLIVKDISLLIDQYVFLYVITGIGFGIITSLIGGIYPALKASEMKPIDSLKYE
jgi:ABC-type transport system, involved in lipoprotein release, permease component